MMDRIISVGMAVCAGMIILVIAYYLISFYAYGIARSILQAKKDHEAHKENPNESKRSTP